jgi:hypothetical protein
MDILLAKQTHIDALEAVLAETERLAFARIHELTTERDYWKVIAQRMVTERALAVPMPEGFTEAFRLACRD